MGLGEARVQGFEGGVEFLQGALLSQGLEEEGFQAPFPHAFHY